MIAALRPVLTTDPRPTDPSTTEARYVRSFLWLRTFVGALGIALPVALVFIDKGAFHGTPFPRGSLSAYYYSGVREIFVAILSATGVFFVAYKVAERNLDNVLSCVAGVAAVFIAIFPTSRDSHDVPLTPLQKLLHESVVSGIHFAVSTTFLLALTVMSYFFGVRERNRPPRAGMKRSPEFWQWYHWTCASAMALALLWIVVTLLVDWPSHSLLIGEWVATWAFGASWLMKGLELDALRGRPGQPLAAAPP